MTFALGPFRRYPLHASVTYNAGSSQGPDTVWSLVRSGWRLSGNLPMQSGKASH